MCCKKAYIILAHNNPIQLLRLMKRLNDDNTWFFLHIDIRVSIEIFRSVLGHFSNLTWVERENGRWGGLGIVKATLNALSQILNHPVKLDTIHLLSGNDYPIVSNKTINDFIASHQGKNFIEYFAFPVEKWDRGGLTRLTWYNFVRMQNYNRWKFYFLAAVNKIIRIIPFLRRRFPHYLEPFGGSQWWSITWETASYILKFVKDHPDYIYYHRYSLLPDEIFFQTILLNSKEKWLRDSLVNDNLRYIVWSKPGETKFPLTFSMDDYENIVHSGKLWARKFDMSLDSEILDMLDKRMEENIIS